MSAGGQKGMDFDECISFDNLYKGLKASCRNVRWKNSVIRYENDALKNTYKLRKDIQNKKYKIQQYQTFEIFEPKRRTVVATRIRDRQFQHALVDNYVYEALTKSFIADNCACQKYRGVDYCIRRFTQHLVRYYADHGRSNEGYFLKCDVSNYFGSINHEIMIAKLTEIIHDEKILNELGRIVNSFDGDVGLGLGSQCNQLFALALLNDLDHFIKEKLRIKYYIRYMDDFILLHSDREYLKQCRDQIENFLKRFGLRFSLQKTIIQPIKHGIHLLKWRFILTDTGRVIRKMDRKKVYKQQRKIKKLYEREQIGAIEAGTCDDSMRSFMANAERGHSFKERYEVATFYNSLTHGEKHYHDYVKRRDQKEKKMIQPSINVPLDDVKKILANYFGVDEKAVIRNQYSFTVIGGKIPEQKEEEREK